MDDDTVPGYSEDVVDVVDVVGVVVDDGVHGTSVDLDHELGMMTANDLMQEHVDDGVNDTLQDDAEQQIQLEPMAVEQPDLEQSAQPLQLDDQVHEAGMDQLSGGHDATLEHLSEGHDEATEPMTGSHEVVAESIPEAHISTLEHISEGNDINADQTPEAQNTAAEQMSDVHDTVPVQMSEASGTGSELQHDQNAEHAENSFGVMQFQADPDDPDGQKRTPGKKICMFCRELNAVAVSFCRRCGSQFNMKRPPPVPKKKTSIVKPPSTGPKRPMVVKKCPNCTASNMIASQFCKCGYNFRPGMKKLEGYKDKTNETYYQPKHPDRVTKRQLMLQTQQVKYYSLGVLYDGL